MLRKSVAAVSVTMVGIVGMVVPGQAATSPSREAGSSRTEAAATSWGPFSPGVTLVRVGGKPSGANRCAWNGRWSYTGDGGENYGYMVLKTQGPQARSLAGHYTGGGASGTIWGNLNSPCGHIWKGEYEDSSGFFNSGGHRTVLNDDRRSFRGKFATCDTYWPFDRFCTYRWSGTKV